MGWKQARGMKSGSLRKSLPPARWEIKVAWTKMMTGTRRLWKLNQYSQIQPSTSETQRTEHQGTQESVRWLITGSVAHPLGTEALHSCSEPTETWWGFERTPACPWHQSSAASLWETLKSEAPSLTHTQASPPLFFIIWESSTCQTWQDNQGCSRK